MTAKKTPQTNQEFIDYRIGEVEDKLDRIESKIDNQNYLSEPVAVKMFSSKNDHEKLVNRVSTLEKDQSKRDKYWFTFASAVIGILALAAYNILTTGGPR